jgi:multisubunit Na+/H+ antiporter MnhE subunit
MKKILPVIGLFLGILIFELASSSTNIVFACVKMGSDNSMSTSDIIFGVVVGLLCLLCFFSFLSCIVACSCFLYDYVKRKKTPKYQPKFHHLKIWFRIAFRIRFRIAFLLLTLPMIFNFFTSAQRDSSPDS